MVEYTRMRLEDHKVKVNVSYPVSKKPMRVRERRERELGSELLLVFRASQWW
jgi:hypothetical protein